MADSVDGELITEKGLCTVEKTPNGNNHSHHSSIKNCLSSLQTNSIVDEMNTKMPIWTSKFKTHTHAHNTSRRPLCHGWWCFTFWHIGTTPSFKCVFICVLPQTRESVCCYPKPFVCDVKEFICFRGGSQLTVLVLNVALYSSVISQSQCGPCRV